MKPTHFANSKTLHTFATHNITIGKYACRKFVAGFFYACTIIIFSVTPVWCINVPTTADGVLDNRSVALFFIATKQTNISEMSNTETTCLKGNNSTHPKPQRITAIRIELWMADKFLLQLHSKTNVARLQSYAKT